MKPFKGDAVLTTFKKLPKPDAGIAACAKGLRPLTT